MENIEPQQLQTTPVTSETPPSNLQPVENPPKHSNFLRIFFIGLALILFGTLVGVLVSRFLPMSKTTVTPSTTTSIVTPTSTFSPELTAEQDATLDSTSGWKTYTNTELGIEFKYPNSWNSFSQVDKVIAFSDNNEEGMSQLEGILADFSIKNNTVCDITKLFESKGPISAKFGNCTQDSLMTTKDYVLITFTFIPNENIPTEILYAKGFAVKKADKVYIFNMESFNKENINTITLDKILSTFKFTNQPSAEGKFCGGIAANLPENQCPAGFYCKKDGNYPDAGGVCTKN